MSFLKNIPHKKVIAISIAWIIVMSGLIYTATYVQYDPESGQITFVRGLTGETGVEGGKGEKGETGDTGEKGDTGNAGEDVVNSAEYVIYIGSSGNVIADASASSGLGDIAGTSDARPVIQEALDNVEIIGGGVVYLKEGTFILETSTFVAGVGGGWDGLVGLQIPSDVSLLGSGFSTIITQDTEVNCNVIIVNTVWAAGAEWDTQKDYRLRVAHLKVDGNIQDQNYTGVGASGFKATGIMLQGDYNRIDNVYVVNCGMYGGIALYGSYNLVTEIIVENTVALVGDAAVSYATGIWVSSFHNHMNEISNVIIRDCDGHGIFLEDHINNTIISDFHIENCSEGISVNEGFKTQISSGTIQNCSGNTGLLLIGDDHTVENVHISDCASAEAIKVSTGRAIISSCTMINNGDYGIIVSADATDVIIDSCMIKDTQAVPTQNGIITAGNRTIVSNCQIHNATVNGVALSDVDSAIITGNMITGAGAWGINMIGTSDYCIITDNDLRGSANIMNVRGDNNQISGNLGFVTENSGTALILNGQTSVTIDHGLAGTPTVVVVTGEHAETSDAVVTSKTATQITITVPAAVTANRTVNWYVEYKP